MEQKNNGKSLYIYTGLIFIVAVIILMITFWGQEHLAQERNGAKVTQATNSISERASALSDENRLLLEKTHNLSEQITQQSAKVTELSNDKELLLSIEENTNNLIKSYLLCIEKKFTQANEVYSTLDMNLISDELSSFYTDVGNRIRKGLK